MSLVEVKRLSKSFYGHAVLNDVDLTVESGEVVCLLGASGAGKSTLLRCINDLEHPDSGEVWVDGDPIGYRLEDGVLYELPEKLVAAQRVKIGMVFQRFNLFPNRTVLENIIEGPIYVLGRGRGDAVDEAHKLLRQVGLEEKALEYPGYLSGGQQQRVAIARSLAMHPKLILFDEPTSALDPELVGEVTRTMAQLAQDGMTMIVVTHLVEFARKVADRVLFMADGKIIEQGPPQTVLDNPQDPRTRKFLAAI